MMIRGMEGRKAGVSRDARLSWRASAGEGSRRGLRTMVMGWLSPIGMRAATWCLTLVVMVCLVAALSAPAPVLGAQEIAILKSADLAAYSQAVAAFKDTMDPSVVYTEYNLRGDAQEGRKLARRIRASDASLVLAVGLKAALAAKLELVDVPVIFCMVLDPVRYELKAPNMTGILLEIPIERHLSTIRQALPAVRRIGVLFDPGKSQSLVDEARRQARMQGFELVAKSVASDKDVAAAAHGLTSQIDLLWLIPDSTVLSEDSLRFLMDLALEHNIPSVGFSSEFVRSGALLALSVSYLDTGRQAAQVARKFLNGEGSDLSGRLLAPNQTRITVNSKTARYLGLTIPPEIIRQAESIN